MKKMTIYYGSTTGTCETLAASIAQALGMSNDNVHNVTEMTKEDLENNDVLILGSSTWGPISTMPWLIAAVPSLGKSQLPTTRLLLLQPWTVMISSVWHLTT